MGKVGSAQDDAVNAAGEPMSQHDTTPIAEEDKNVRGCAHPHVALMLQRAPWAFFLSQIQAHPSISGGEPAHKTSIHAKHDSSLTGFGGAQEGGHPDMQGNGAPEGYKAGGSGDIRADQDERDRVPWEMFQERKPDKEDLEGSTTMWP